MLSSQEIQTIRDIVHSLIADHDVSYRVPPFDNELFQASVDEALRRGYPIDEHKSFREYLRFSVAYVATSTGRTDLPARIWLALYMTFNYYVDDVPSRFPTELPHVYMFNERFTKGQKQGNAPLNALADIIHQVPNIFSPVLSNIVTTSALNFVTANLLEYETTSMQVSDAAEQYPGYLRTLSGFTDAYIFMAFPREIPLVAYIQAIPRLNQFINEVNDVLSFYKEELDGETTNQVSLIAAQNREPKLETLKRMADSMRNVTNRIFEILKECPEACDAFRQYVIGFFDFHFRAERYRLAELDL